MHFRPVLFLLTAAILVLFSASSCKKDKLLQSGGELRFSVDTLDFDTVFTAQGSFTLGLKIYNPQSDRVKLSSVGLFNGAASFFNLNVNGEAGKIVRDMEIAGNDSIYVFATVNIDPNSDNSPFLIEDKIVAVLNGNQYTVPLRARGQNAHYIRGEVLPTQTFLTDKPYVIIGGALIEQGNTLTIPAGCRIYMHADSRLIIQGTLIAEGSKTDSIIFQGDRLDRAYFGYEDYPGEWGGLYFDSRSTGNRLRHVIIKNCGNNALGALSAAIQINKDSVVDAIPQVYLDRVTIENVIGYGIISFGGDLKMDNCMVHSCGAQALAMVQGGKGEFNYCDFVINNPKKLTHADNPAVVLLNYFEISSNNFLKDSLGAIFRNCMIYGSLKDELVGDLLTPTPYNVTMQNCLIKATEADILTNITRSNCIYNTDPEFEDAAKLNYRLKSSSPLKNAGTSIPSITLDLDDQPRSSNDIGCYRVP